MQNSKDQRIAYSVFFSGFSCFALLYYYQSLLPELSAFFHINKTESSLAVSFATMGMAIGFMISMLFADRFERKKLIAYSLLISSLISLISSYAVQFSFLAVSNLFKGFFLSGAASISLAYISEEVSLQNRLKVTSLYIAGNAVGGMFGRIFVAYFGHQLSWQWSSFWLSIICFLFAVLFFLFAPKSEGFIPKNESTKTIFKSNLGYITHHQLIPIYITGFIILGVFVSIYNYLQFILVQPPFLLPKEWMPYLCLLYIFGIFGSVGTTQLEKYFSTHTLLVWIPVTMSIGILFLYSSNLAVLFMGLAVFTFGFFIMHVLCNKRLGELFPEKRSVIIAIYLLLYYTGSSIVGTSTGVILENFGWEYFLASLIFLSMIITWIFIKHGQQ